MKTALLRALTKQWLRGGGSLANERFFHRSGADATGANADGTDATRRILVADGL